MGSGKLKDKSQGETLNGKSNARRLKPNKLDTIRISAVENMKGHTEKISESLTTILNIKENEKPVRESNLPITEEEVSGYKTLIQTQKSRVVDDATSPNKKLGVTFESNKLASGREVSSDRQVLLNNLSMFMVNSFMRSNFWRGSIR